MNKSFLILLLFWQLGFSQEKPAPTIYKHGHNGMELIMKSNSGTVIISTFNSKMAIKDEVAEKVYDAFKKNEIVNGQPLTIIINQATVIGTCQIKKKGTLTAVNFYYEKVEWASGLVEVYRGSFRH
jgi:hypothetical protein